MVVSSNPIFDESKPDSFFIHRWANYLHTNTTEHTILNNLPFAEGELVSDRELAEAQRLLRREPYIRDAQITRTEKDPHATEDEGDTVLVETWDNWSLLPTVSYSKSGGNTKYSFGVKEDNLMGLGIKTDVKYKVDKDRTGYKFAFDMPLTFIKHSNISANFYDNSDGQATQLSFNKPFYSLDTQHSYGAYWTDELRNDTISQNGEDIAFFAHQINYTSVSYGYLLDKTVNDLSRITFGLVQDKHEFENLNDYPDMTLPYNRDFIYPWIGYEYLQDDYKVFNNVYLIHTNEDINLGWHHKVSIGFETNDIADGASLGYHINLSSQRGWQTDNQLLILNLAGQADIQTSKKDFYNIGLTAEYFYLISPKWTAYSKARISTSANNYLDRPFALGDETGIRGYPNDYQYGDNQWLFTAELRNYPNINLYQLAELGWAIFSDVGQAFGGPDELNEVSGIIGSIGIGARIYSSKSSYGNIAHIDIAKPFTSGAEVNSWEWRFQIKSHF
ncbi:hypothetical protein HBH39_16115 [Shewanella aestuarii]|uniref:Haemolysin activator HlyB C-terminal domain-containing protein n=1 Tax=Shewanella aestuarii TaxID=1028752 RepID=A0A6G9QR28_9GAMM|nr:hypothetical protein HBH39_16115 [Shewanella aestuarii]